MPTYLKINITLERIRRFLKEHGIEPTSQNVEAVGDHLVGIATAWAGAEMQDAKKEDVLEWIEWAKDDQPT